MNKVLPFPSKTQNDEIKCLIEERQQIIIAMKEKIKYYLDQIEMNTPYYDGKNYKLVEDEELK